MKAEFEVEDKRVILKLLPEGEGDQTLLNTLEGMESFGIQFEADNEEQCQSL